MSSVIKQYQSLDLVRNALLNAKINPMTSTERLALSLTADDTGYTVWDTTYNAFYVWTGTSWVTAETTTINTISPLQYNAVTGNLAITQSSASTDGYLSSADWSKFDTAYLWGNHALAGYALNSGVVHLAGTETITGAKTFTANTHFNDQVTISGAITAGSFVKIGGLSTQFLKADGSLDSNIYLTNISSIIAGGELSGTYPNPTLVNSAVTGKVLSGLNLTGGGTIAATDTILEAFGKVQNQISAMVGGVNYQDVWDASTNTPALTSGVGNKGDYYIVSVAGSTNLDGITDWKVGDWAIFNGTTWDKVDNTDAVSSVNGYTGAVSLVTSDIAEAGNLYYTDARARAAISSTAIGLNYSSITGEITLTPGYVIPTTAQEANWNTAYANRITSLTTTGTSGGATLIGNTLNIPQYQPLLTNPVTGTGASGQVSYWNGTNTQTGSNNLFWDAGNNRLGIGTTTPTDLLTVNASAAYARIQSTGTGSNVDAGFYMTTYDGTAVTTVGGFGGTNTNFTFADYKANAVYLYANRAGGLGLYATHASGNLRFYTGGNQASNMRGWISSAGRWIINSATDNGVNQLQVNGSVSVSSINITGLTTGSIPFVGASGLVTQDNANLVWDNTNKRLGVGTNTPLYPIHLQGSINGKVVARIVNTSTGGSAESGWFIGNGTSNMALFQSGTGYTAYGAITADSSVLYTSSKLVFAVDNITNPIIWATGNGSTLVERMRLVSAGRFLINTTTDNGSDYLQVRGSSLFDQPSGYTGSLRTDALKATNNAAGTGANLNTPALNAGGSFAAIASTTGYNVGMRGVAFGSSSYNIGFYGDATINSTGVNVGAFGRGYNTTETYVGGFFTNNVSASFPTISGSAALIADNGTTTSHIFVLQDNGVAVAYFADGGNLTVPNVTANSFIKSGGTSAQYLMADGSVSTNPGWLLASTASTTYVPLTRTITINGVAYDLSADRSWTVTSMVYPSAGIAVSTGTAWGASITDNSANWNTAYSWGNHATAGYQPAATAITTSNIGSQSVAYATSAGTASSANALSGITSSISSPVQSATISSILGQDTNNNLYRYNASAVQTFLGLGSMAYASTGSYYTASTSDGRYAYVGGSNASGTWGISITGSASSASYASTIAINYDNNSNSTYQVLWGSGSSVYGTGGVYVNPYTDYLYATSFTASSWFRSNGDTGWYNESYAGGIYMTDTTWVRTYNSKGLYSASEIRGNVLRSETNIYTDQNYGYGLVGYYASSRYQGVFAMGDAYKLPADGSTTGSLYGLAWSHPNAGGVAANLNTHGLLVMENGAFLAAVSGSIRARDDMRAPIFYDQNDTGYYADFNSSSDSAIRLRGGMLVGPNTSWGAYLQVGGNGRGGTYATVTTTNGNLHLNAADGYSTYINYYSGGTIYLGTTGSYTITGNGSYYNGSAAYANNSGALNGWGYTSYAYRASGSGYYQIDTWIALNGDYGIYAPGSSGFSNTPHFYPNISSSYGAWMMTGARNGWAGLNIQDPSGYNHQYMHESGNGGLLSHDRWVFYHHRGNNCLGIGDSATSSSYKLYVSGSIYATGDVVAYSDCRKKTNIVTINNALETVTKMRGVFYDKIGEEEKGRQLGVIAQEVNEVLPEAVTYAKDIDEYGVKYGNMVGLLLEAIKEQQSQIESQKTEISELKDLVKQLLK